MGFTQKAIPVKLLKSLPLGFLLASLMPTVIMAQAFGEYGRTLGGVTDRGSIGSSAAGGISPGRGKSERIGDIGGRGVPSRLIVVAKQAPLFPRQDDEAEKITGLAQGEILVPLLQSAGGNDWYMVKTQNGFIGWVKSSDVREESLKK
jgi:hypothetical protein